MGKISLSDVVVTSLKKISTNGGDVLHAIKSSDQGYCGFNEAYFSWVEPGAIKAWKMHKFAISNLVVPYGLVKFAFCASDPGVVFRTEIIGEDKYSRLTVPAGIWFGFQGISSAPSLILNITNMIHDPDEIDRRPVDYFSTYIWN
jgi:dTDP-4-dehydrorhamnose 3,5-epimerase